MSKFIEIFYCMQCPHKTSKDECGLIKAHTLIPLVAQIPEWCPLPNMPSEPMYSGDNKKQSGIDWNKVRQIDKNMKNLE